MSTRVSLFEVGVRDGLQNEPRPVSLGQKLMLAQGLIDAGLRDLELGAFVRPDLVPQMADTDQVYAAIKKGSLRLGKTKAWALVPNAKGLERAIASGVQHIAVFTAATEAFARRNIGMSIGESLEQYAEVIAEAKRRRIEVRGYVSTVFGCPFEGATPVRQALRVILKLAKLGVTEVSVGDTIGVATPKDVNRIVSPLMSELGVKRVAVHFHDTRGTALANTLRSMDLGVRRIDSSAGGLGGCPFAPGATGNLATEDLVYMLDGMGVKSGVDLARLAATSLKFSRKIDRPPSSRYLQAYAAACISNVPNRGNR